MKPLDRRECATDHMPTIFDNVVTKENDHTNLLRNLMERNRQVASIILSYLLGRKLSDEDVASFDFRTQHSFVGENGREIPDILVKGPNFRCIIEAKVDPALDLTDAQKRGYGACFAADEEQHLCFLVPNEWKYRDSANQVTALLGETASVSTSCWRELIEKLDEIS